MGGDPAQQQIAHAERADRDLAARLVGARADPRPAERGGRDDRAQAEPDAPQRVQPGDALRAHSPAAGRMETTRPRRPVVNITVPAARA